MVIVRLCPLGSGLTDARPGRWWQSSLGPSPRRCLTGGWPQVRLIALGSRPWTVGGRRVGPGENCTHACMPLKASRESLSLAEAINSVDAVPKKGGKYERPGTVGGTRPVPSIWYL